MSRAFVRESDDRPELPVARPASALPLGAKNYITLDGAERLRAELAQLVTTERPPLVGRSDDPEAKRRLLALNQRIEELTDTLNSVEIVPPPENVTDIVRFGARVTVRNRAGDELTYRIIGVDEADFDEDSVSWISPIARALMGRQVGDRVWFKSPAGDDELTVLSVSYGATSHST